MPLCHSILTPPSRFIPRVFALCARGFCPPLDGRTASEQQSRAIDIVSHCFK